eukprot:171071-Amphidinium_carterae.1
MRPTSTRNSQDISLRSKGHITTEQIEWTSEITSATDYEHEGSGYDAAVQTVEDYYKNLFIDNEYGDLNNEPKKHMKNSNINLIIKRENRCTQQNSKTLGNKAS